MRVFRGFEEAAGIINPVVTTGSFDGVHVGHKAILKRLNALSEKYEGDSVLITFHPHPRKVLYPDTLGKDLKLINSQEEKQYLLSQTGLKNLIIAEFTRDFSRVTSEEFVSRYLAGILKAKVVVVGFNHHFGFNKEGDYRQLWEMRSRYGFEAEEIPEQDVENETVSSTRIRKAISEGYIQRANAYLDHHYLIMARTVSCNNLSELTDRRFFCLPLTEESKQLPPPGLYAVSVATVGSSIKGLVLIASENSNSESVFLHTPGVELPDGQNVSLYFQKKISGEVRVSDKTNLSARISRALEEISDLIY
jgi:riboflavin kinase/FMN adenylyltransferase